MTTALIILGLAVAYAVSLYLIPVRTCPRCNGTGTRLTTTGRATGRTCGRCRGDGRIRRPGATAVHRLYWSVIGDTLREHRRDALRRERHDQHPDL
jgi:tRNA(Ile2) C34 agmatinyltransferase TiaS